MQLAGACPRRVFPPDPHFADIVTYGGVDVVAVKEGCVPPPLPPHLADIATYGHGGVDVVGVHDGSVPLRLPGKRSRRLLVVF